MSIQDVYNVNQQIGYVGQAPARPGQSFGEDNLVIAAAGVEPGEAFLLDGSGQVVLPADATAALAAVGVVSYSQNTLNTAITQTVNHKSGVVYAIGDTAPCLVDGHIYVLIGGAVNIGSGVNYDPATKKWTAGGVSSKAAFIADGSGVDGDIIAIRVTRIA